MPNEIRHIIFTPEDLKVALTRYFKSKSTILPRGEVLTCKFERTSNNNSVKYSILIRPDTVETTEEMVLKSNEVAASLLAYCFEEKIPVPRRAAKSLRIMGDNLALSFFLPQVGDSEAMYMHKTSCGNATGADDIWAVADKA
jgi:hypothetical protein